MQLLRYKGYEGSAEVDMTHGVCRGKLLFVNDLVTYEAESPKALETEFRRAVDDYVETCKALGREPKKPLKGLFNVRVPPAMHEAAVRRGVTSGASLNEVVIQALAVYLGAPQHVTNNVTVNVQSNAESRTIVTGTNRVGTLSGSPIHVH